MPGRLALLLSGLMLAGALPSALEAAQEMVWREVEPENLVIMALQDGDVLIELNPAFAPKTVRQFLELVEEHFYDGLGFYRVIDGFVAQGGDGSDLGELSDKPTIEAEFEIDWSDELAWTPVQNPDLFAPETGFIDGFAAARDPKDAKVWLTHCPGVVAMARSDGKDTSRTDFYIVIGQAPRYLDRNMNIFGRVILGMQYVQRILRGPASSNGVIESDTGKTRIRTMTRVSDIPEEERLFYYVMDTHSDAFEDLLKDRRKRKQKFFHEKPPRVLDVCQVPVASRTTK